MRKWSICIEYIRGIWVGIVFLGKESRGTVTADDLQTCMSMVAEMLEMSDWPSLSEIEMKKFKELPLRPEGDPPEKGTV